MQFTAISDVELLHESGRCVPSAQRPTLLLCRLCQELRCGQKSFGRGHGCLRYKERKEKKKKKNVCFVCHSFLSLSLCCLSDQKLRNFDLAVQNKHGIKLGIRDFLIMPVQRVPRYILLLKDILKHTETTHRDYQDLKDAMAMLQVCLLHFVLPLLTLWTLGRSLQCIWIQRLNARRL